jgi:hypothetical protein
VHPNHHFLVILSVLSVNVTDSNLHALNKEKNLNIETLHKTVFQRQNKGKANKLETEYSGLGWEGLSILYVHLKHILEKVIRSLNDTWSTFYATLPIFHTINIFLEILWRLIRWFM